MMNNDIADYDLVFTSHGSVQLLQNPHKNQLWASDADDDFSDEFEGDFFDEDDSEEIIEYLIERNLLDESDEIDIVEEDLEDFDDDDNVIEGQFTQVKRPKAKRKSS